VTREALADKPLIHVACGVLQRADGKVLLAQRPDGKIAAGRWEFPGGKIEAGEQPLHALVRELDEELGVHVEQARPLIRYRHEYSNRSVLLDTWLVSRFSGDPHGRENQALAWLAPAALKDWPDTLPTVAPSARAVNLPVHYVFTRPDASVEQVLEGLPQLPSACLLRLRFPQLSDTDYAAAARQILPVAQQSGLRVVLDRSFQQAGALGADGWHASEASMLQMRGRAAPGPALQLASCHSAQALRHAVEAGFDAIVMGAVQATTTHPAGATLGWDGFAEAIQYAGVPAYAIGGVGPAQLDTVFAAYGQGVAGISAYW
jgi:8-oxo-dGTP diphosphatase